MDGGGQEIAGSVTVDSRFRGNDEKEWSVERQPAVYIMASGRHGTLYVGVTNDLERRMHEHKHPQAPCFTSKYKVHRLVYCEETDDISAAIAREKQLKRWLRERKIALIESVNPDWADLSEGWYDESPWQAPPS